MELLNEFLKLLGKTPNEIAFTLSQCSITGVRRRPGRCPLAKAITESQLMGGPVLVDQIYIQPWTVGAEERLANSFNLTDEHDAIRGFIRNFDDGCYPFLEEAIE